MAKKSTPPRVPASPRESEKEDGNPALVPKLRFPEFRDAEGWKTKKLASLVQLVSGVHLSPGQYSGEGLVPYFTGPSDFTNRTQDITKRTSDSTNLAIENDTLITVKGSGVGEIWYLSMPSVAIGRQLMALRAIDASSRFIFQFLLTKRRRFEDLAAGNLIPGLSRGDILDLESAFPSLPEQQKIASCLSTLDELIGAQGRKVAALRTHKKGLMQQLFPREGETQPRLRFPEFQDAGDWEERALGEIGRVIRGSSPRPKGDSRYYGGPVPRLMVQDVTRDGKWVTPRIDSLTKEGAKLSRPCPAGTFTIVCSGNVGVVSFLAVDACIHDGFLALMDINEQIIVKDFLFHSLSTLRERFEKDATHGGVFTNLTTSTIEQFQIMCPGPLEQQRIASCLTSLDELITAETQKLEALKTHKRGLMQQLFPSPEDAS